MFQANDPLTVLIFIGSIMGAFIIAFILWYFRDVIFGVLGRIEKTAAEEIIESNLSRIRDYAREQNYNNASILIYQTFAIGAEYYLKVKRNSGETARELAMKVIGKEDIDAKSVNTLIATFEAARYSNRKISVQEFNDALRSLHRFLQVATEQPIIEDDISSGTVSRPEIETTTS
ncbi:MAG: DUF4129 domain-containing protein [Candidatus Hodarchaeota archaeon]